MVTAPATHHQRDEAMTIQYRRHDGANFSIESDHQHSAIFCYLTRFDKVYWSIEIICFHLPSLLVMDDVLL